MVFDPNFAIYQQQRTSIPLLEGRVDGYPVEEHQLSLGTTENPVESGSVLTDNAVKRRERLRLEGWVSDILPAPGNELSPNRQPDVWSEIVQIFENKTLLTVYTGLRVYNNMVISRAVAPVNRNTGRALRFTIDLAEMLFSDTDISRFPPDEVAEDGPAADRTSEVDRGDLATPGTVVTRYDVVFGDIDTQAAFRPTGPLPELTEEERQALLDLGIDPDE